ncbi:MAG: serine hydrolase [Bacteroidetes bacterium]|nr:serine hydrolase [Bacteroidota bacterium]
MKRIQGSIFPTDRMYVPAVCVLLLVLSSGCSLTGIFSGERPETSDDAKQIEVVAEADSVQSLPVDNGSLFAAPDTAAAAGEASHPAEDVVSSASADVWVDSVMATLDWRRCIAQLIVPFTYSDVSARTMNRMRSAVLEHGVGGVLLSRGGIADAVELIDSLQSWAATPLLISADFETGPGMRLRDALVLPSMMALAATRDTGLAYRAGRAIAEASLEIGVGQNYAPVADVNSNPLNPIINTRSFGERASLVADMAEASMRGMQDAGMIATAKHFPGHGDTHIDSHSGLPLIDVPLSRLDSIDLLPFRRLIAAGVRSVMSAHIAVPALTGDSTLPATLHAAVMDTLLRQRYGFTGLVVTDAMNMKALTRTGVTNPAVVALQAGSDILLMPGDIGQTIDSIAAAVQRGEIDSMRVLQSVRRILEAKQHVRMSAVTERNDSVRMQRRVQHNVLANRIAGQAVTLLRNDGLILPLADGQRIAVISFVRKDASDDVRNFIARLRERYPSLRELLVPRSASRSVRTQQQRWVRDSLRGVDVVVFASHITTLDGAGSIGLSAEQRHVASLIGEQGLPRVHISLGSPYVLAAIPDAEALLCSYGNDPASQDAVLSVLTGGKMPRGRLPVSIPGIAEFGDGMQQFEALPEFPDITRLSFSRVDSLITEQIRRGATPGAQLAVVYHDSLIHLRSYGRYTYEEDAPVVTDTTMFDLASLNKVVVTTTLAMQLIERGLLHLDSSVAQYLTEFGKNGKGEVTIRHLLEHSSGLPAYRFFHLQGVSGEAISDSIFAMSLRHAPGSRYVYSDIGIIVLAWVIERITGVGMDSYAKEEFFQPLGMRHTMFTPPDSLRRDCAPTEVDLRWRKRLVQGEVHDETAALLGGVAGHAGLFSTAADLSLFVRMLINGGELDGVRYLAGETIAGFTLRQSPRSSRALGWDTRSASGSSSGRYFSDRSYGHTGFTGTSIWIDPESRVGVIFLGNRVHPTRENRMLPRFRATLHDAIREAIIAGVEAP